MKANPMGSQATAAARLRPTSQVTTFQRWPMPASAASAPPPLPPAACQGGGEPPARISGLWALPHRRPPPIVRWCEGPFPAPPPWPMPSSLGPARWRTTAPAPGASAPRSSVDDFHLLSSKDRSISLTLIIYPPPTTAHPGPVPPQIYPIFLRSTTATVPPRSEPSPALGATLSRICGVTRNDGQKARNWSRQCVAYLRVRWEHTGQLWRSNLTDDGRCDDWRSKSG